jgi:hypothetical protein
MSERLILPGGADPYPYDETVDAALVASGAALGANTLALMSVPNRSTPLTVAKLRITIDTTDASGHVDVGIWQTLDYVTATLLYSSGSTAVAGVGIQTFTLGTPLVHQPGVQWYCGLCPDGATAKFGRAVAGYTAQLLLLPDVGSKASMFPLASNATSITLSTLAALTSTFWMRGSAT